MEQQPDPTESLAAGEDSTADTEEQEQISVECSRGEVCTVSQPPPPPLLPHQLLLVRRLPPQVRLQLLPPQPQFQPPPPPPLLQQQQQREQQYAVSCLETVGVPMPNIFDCSSYRPLSCRSFVLMRPLATFSF